MQERARPQPAPLHPHLGTGQLPALPGLRALRHLDLDLVRVGEVVGRHPEPAGGDLLDGRAAVVRETAGILAPFAGVRPPSDLVHLV